LHAPLRGYDPGLVPVPCKRTPIPALSVRGGTPSRQHAGRLRACRCRPRSRRHPGCAGTSTREWYRRPLTDLPLPAQQRAAAGAYTGAHLPRVRDYGAEAHGPVTPGAKQGPLKHAGNERTKKFIILWPGVAHPASSGNGGPAPHRSRR
jgi:hypothetical protein